MRLSQRFPRLLPALAALMLAAAPAAAGTISLGWDPVADADLAGYRVYYGTAAGVYTSSVDVGNTTSTTVTNLTDCTTWYLAVKAYDTAGNLSEAYSNEVSGWPRPSVASVAPSAAEQGRRLSLTVTGANYQPGATLSFANAGITVHAVTVNSCTTLTADVTVGGTAAPGVTDAEVMNADRVFGTGTGLFRVDAAVAPTVTSTNPADGATGVAVTVQPTVTFSEPVQAATVTAATVRLLDENGAAVAQAAGYPQLNAAGTVATIRPAASLAQGKSYKVEVAGGATGVLDLAGHGMASTYRHATGFTTADATAPAISGIQASEVGATSARILWTTDEPADSQVFYRKQGDTAYLQTTVDPARVTSHSVLLQGLDPQTTYQYHVRSADAGGNASTSSPDQTFATTASTYGYLRVEAEDGTVVSPARRVTGAAFEGSWIDTTAGGTATAPGGTATLGVHVPTAGSWTLWLRMYGPSTSADSWFESVDGSARASIVAPAVNAWTWVKGTTYTLSAGLHTVEIGGREASARADRVLLTNDPGFVPTEQPGADQASPAPVNPFTATPGDAQVVLNWTNPADADFRKTVIRVRTDNRDPQTPADGLPVTEVAGTPGSTGTFTHTGLTNGTGYRYAAFAVDAAGNAADEALAAATPAAADAAPGQVKNNRRKDKKP